GLTLLARLVLDILLALTLLPAAVALLFLRVRILLARLVAVLRIPRVIVGAHPMLRLRFTWLTPLSRALAHTLRATGGDIGGSPLVIGDWFIGDWFIGDWFIGDWLLIVLL